jgi:hypothetical protein
VRALVVVVLDPDVELRLRVSDRSPRRVKDRT